MADEWTPVSSRAIEAFRFLPVEGFLQIIYRKGRMVYDFPCDQNIYQQFLAAGSKGHFVRPHARQLGWARAPWKFRG
jgi:hypothetical protein